MTPDRGGADVGAMASTASHSTDSTNGLNPIHFVSRVPVHANADGTATSRMTANGEAGGSPNAPQNTAPAPPHSAPASAARPGECTRIATNNGNMPSHAGQAAIPCRPAAACTNAPPIKEAAKSADSHAIQTCDEGNRVLLATMTRHAKARDNAPRGQDAARHAAARPPSRAENKQSPSRTPVG